MAPSEYRLRGPARCSERTSRRSKTAYSTDSRCWNISWSLTLLWVELTRTPGRRAVKAGEKRTDDSEIEVACARRPLKKKRKKASRTLTYASETRAKVRPRIKVRRGDRDRKQTPSFQNPLFLTTLGIATTSYCRSPWLQPRARSVRQYSLFNCRRVTNSIGIRCYRLVYDLKLASRRPVESGASDRLQNESRLRPVQQFSLCLAFEPCSQYTDQSPSAQPWQPWQLQREYLHVMFESTSEPFGTNSLHTSSFIAESAPSSLAKRPIFSSPVSRI